MKTGSWFTTLPADHIKIGISRGIPRRMEAGYRLYRKLAPGPWFNSCASADAYDVLYQREVLGRLDAGRVHDEIMALSRGRTPVLVCWERPGTGTCHRALVSEWFLNKLGLIVPQVGYEAAPRHPLEMRLARLKAPSV